MEEYQKDGTIWNIFIFISDALRWDYTPKALLEEGMSFKTVASGGATPLSITSIMTGLYPPRHGVFDWKNIIPRNISLFGIHDLNIGFYNAAGPNDGVSHILQRRSQDKLDDIKSPFIFIERDHGAHGPYRGAGYKQTHEEMVREIGTDKDKIRKRYTEAVECSVNRFKDRLKLLEAKGELKNTLAIFTSDHGEILGEYGLLGHCSPPCPELVYVPTIFYHPRLPKGIQSGIMGHVDIFPTLLAKLGYDLPKLDGVNILDENSRDIKRYNLSHESIFVRDRFITIYKASSIWGKHGGHVFNSRRLRFLATPVAFLFLNRWASIYLRANYRRFPEAIGRYLKPYIRYGEPSMSKGNAKSYIVEIERRTKRAEEAELEEKVKKRLRELGYLQR